MVVMMHPRGVVPPVPACCWAVPLFTRLSPVRVSFTSHHHSHLIVLDHSELLVDVVDVILDGSGIDEKFLGVTLFALVPNTTEFMNAISFALNGNIALRSVHFNFS